MGRIMHDVDVRESHTPDQKYSEQSGKHRREQRLRSGGDWRFRTRSSAYDPGLHERLLGCGDERQLILLYLIGAALRQRCGKPPSPTVPAFVDTSRTHPYGAPRFGRNAAGTGIVWLRF
jgi:hypothetical protein